MKAEKSQVVQDAAEPSTGAQPYPLVADLETWSRHAWIDGLQIDALPGLDSLLVCTRNSVYEITILAPQTGEILVRGGQFFPDYTVARLAGCSLGGSFLKTRGIYIGFQMELQHEGRTIITTRVRSISRAAQDGLPA